MLDVTFRQWRGLDEISKVRQVRYAVLRAPLGMPYEESLFAGDDDPDTLHIVAYQIVAYQIEQPIGCLTLMPPDLSQSTPTVQLRGMAVLAELQGKGIGSMMLAYVADLAKVNHWRLWCKAREKAVPFYAANGWHVVGDVFDIPRIGPHFRMEWESQK